MRSALSLLLLLAVPSAMGAGFVMPATCGTGSVGNVTCYNGKLFQMADGSFAPGTNTSLPVASFPANTVCVAWRFLCTSLMATVVASLMNPLVMQGLPCTQQGINETMTVAVGMDATYCNLGLPTVTQLAQFLDIWEACPSNNCNTLTSSAFAARPAALTAAVAALLLAAL